MVGGDGWRRLLDTSAGSEISIRGHSGLADEDAGDQDKEDALPLLLMCLGCLFAHSLFSLPLSRRAHLFLFSPTLSNVRTIQSQAGHDTSRVFTS